MLILFGFIMKEDYKLWILWRLFSSHNAFFLHSLTYKLAIYCFHSAKIGSNIISFIFLSIKFGVLENCIFHLTLNFDIFYVGSSELSLLTDIWWSFSHWTLFWVSSKYLFSLTFHNLIPFLRINIFNMLMIINQVRYISYFKWGKRILLILEYEILEIVRLKLFRKFKFYWGWLFLNFLERWVN